MGNTCTTRRGIVRAFALALILALPAGQAPGQSKALVDSYQKVLGLAKQGRFAEAIPHGIEALSLGLKELGPEHPQTADLAANLAYLYSSAGQPDKAEPLFLRALQVKEKALGRDSPRLVSLLGSLAGFYRATGRPTKAIPLYRRLLAIREKAQGAEHADVAKVLDDLSTLMFNAGRYRYAEPLFRRLVELRGKLHGAEHTQTAVAVNNLAALYQRLGRYDDARPLYERALKVYERAFGPEHLEVATTLNNLALMHQENGDFTAAEPLYKRSLAIREGKLGPDHPMVAHSLNNLALLRKEQGRYGEVEALYKRALAITEKARGPDHPDVGTVLNNLAGVYVRDERHEEAAELYRRDLAIREKTYGPDHPLLAATLNNLAVLHQEMEDLDGAGEVFQRALAIQERSLGAAHPRVASALNNVARVFRAKGLLAETEPLYRRSLQIMADSFGAEHPRVAATLVNLAGLQRLRGKPDGALATVRHATAINRARAARGDGAKSAGSLAEQRANRAGYLAHVEVLAERPDADAQLIDEAFQVAQLARATGTAGAVARMSARFAAGDDRLAKLVRTRQDAVELWRLLDARLLEAASRPPDRRDPQREKQIRAKLRDLEGKLAQLDKLLAGEFPSYAQLAAPSPAEIASVQKLLAHGDGLIAYLAGGQETYLWVLRRDRVRFFRLDISAEDLDATVEELREGLIPEPGEDVPAFDAPLAHDLYQVLFAAAETALDGVRHLYVVPDSGLQSLPLGVLISAAPSGDFTDFSGYRHGRWLARRYALTVLPSVGALPALRRFAARARAGKPFVGFGDPRLAPEGGETRGIDATALFARGGIADADAVRALPSLPDTAGELSAIAGLLRAGEQDVILGAAATEPRVKATDLSDTRVVAFATHGLVSGDISGLAEPALVMTPPEKSTAADDGLLTASEVAQLKLNADWVILSACNTAADDGSPGAEGLSGLAKAFFYAGSRALLVSHWPVVSESTVRITTGIFQALEAEPAIGRAEALRRARLAMIDDAAKPHFAHPMFWAPFVVVGDGG